jgi:hypothetical protein
MNKEYKSIDSFVYYFKKKLQTKQLEELEKKKYHAQLLTWTPKDEKEDQIRTQSEREKKISETEKKLLERFIKDFSILNHSYGLNDNESKLSSGFENEISPGKILKDK